MSPGLADVETLIKEAESMAPLPASATRLASLLADDDWELSDLCEVVRYDPSLTGRVLGAANSVLSSPANEIRTVDEAMMRLGPGQVLAMAIAGPLKDTMNAAVPHYALAEGELWRHSVAAALAVDRARPICRTPIAPEAFAAALLHDVGKLVLGRFLDAESVASIHAAQDQKGLSLADAEAEVLRVSHGELGALVAQAWQLPARIVEGIRHHHAPLYAPDEESRRIAQEVALADAVSTEVGAQCDSYGPPPRFTPALAGRLGISQSSFEKLVEEVAASLDAVMSLYA